MKDVLGYYQILEVSSSASDEEIKNSYHIKAKQWHPDSNPAPEAADVFRKLSEAHTILSDKKARQQYDILSLCCTADNYPQTSDLVVVKDGAEDVDLRAFNQKVVQANFVNYKKQDISKVVNYADALKLNYHNSMINWCLGWWHYKTFLNVIPNAINNFLHPIMPKESCRVLLSNMLAHERAGNFDKAAQCGLTACDYLSSDDQKVVKDYIADFSSSPIRPHPWNVQKLRLMQMIAPAVVIVVLVIILFGGSLHKIFNFSSSQEINYYQNVNMGSRGSLTDDMVVGKVINIPVDKTDVSKLYHFKKAAKIMYGPSDKFDVLKTAEADMTVRLTGITPDNVWARVMIDNGEMGFVRLEVIEKGRGAEIPFGSAIGE